MTILRKHMYRKAKYNRLYKLLTNLIKFPHRIDLIHLKSFLSREHHFCGVSKYSKLMPDLNSKLFFFNIEMNMFNAYEIVSHTVTLEPQLINLQKEKKIIFPIDI